MPDPKMVDKVRSILAKAESTTYEPEAASARFLAGRLMDKHGITEADLNPPQIPYPWPPWVQDPNRTVVWATTTNMQFVTVTVNFR